MLGSVLIDDEVLVDIADKIAARDFYEPAHQTIFAAMVKLYQKHSPVDLLTLGNELRATGKLEASWMRWAVLNI